MEEILKSLFFPVFQCYDTSMREKKEVEAQTVNTAPFRSKITFKGDGGYFFCLLRFLAIDVKSLSQTFFMQQLEFNSYIYLEANRSKKSTVEHLSPLDSSPNLCPIYLKLLVVHTYALLVWLVPM